MQHLLSKNNSNAKSRIEKTNIYRENSGSRNRLQLQPQHHQTFDSHQNNTNKSTNHINSNSFSNRLLSEIHRKKKNMKSNSDVSCNNMMNFSLVNNTSQLSNSVINKNAINEYYCNNYDNKNGSFASDSSRKPSFIAKLNTITNNNNTSNNNSNQKNNENSQQKSWRDNVSNNKKNVY